MSSLPVGTVTFLFSDIEGSTNLWQRHPEAMPGALAQHNAIMRSSIESQHGRVFQVLGDAFSSAFAPLRAIERQPGNLPTPLTSFVGRERDLATVQSMLAPANVPAGGNADSHHSRTRLLTLTGVGGTGKTRLALQAAAAIADRF